jgi:hypothetical protein
MTPRRPPSLDPKGRGDKRMGGKRAMLEDVYGMVPQRLRETVRAGLPKPQCPAVAPHTRREPGCPPTLSVGLASTVFQATPWPMGDAQ